MMGVNFAFFFFFYDTYIYNIDIDFGGVSNDRFFQGWNHDEYYPHVLIMKQRALLSREYRSNSSLVYASYERRCKVIECNTH